VGIDGVPLFPKSKVVMWPIVAIINNLPPLVRISKNWMQLFALWVGRDMPNFQVLLKPLVQHFQSLAEVPKQIKYTTVKTQREKTATVVAYVNNWMLDFKAKAPLQNFKSSGYSACSYCDIYGIYEGTVLYPFSECKGDISNRKHDNICNGKKSKANQAIQNKKPVRMKQIE
jgi:hypothetical protein